MKVKGILLTGMIALSLSTGVIAAGDNSSYEQFSKCTAVTTWLINGRETSKIEKTKLVQIPDGWKVVGTGMYEKTTILFICR